MEKSVASAPAERGQTPGWEGRALGVRVGREPGGELTPHVDARLQQVGGGALCIADPRMADVDFCISGVYDGRCDPSRQKSAPALVTDVPGAPAPQRVLPYRGAQRGRTLWEES